MTIDEPLFLNMALLQGPLSFATKAVAFLGALVEPAVASLRTCAIWLSQRLALVPKESPPSPLRAANTLSKVYRT
jgi:hypothetical protein